MVLRMKLYWLLPFVLMACGSASLDRLKRDLDRYPEYSIVLEDMREDGNFFKEYFHRYKIVYGETSSGSEELEYQSEVTDWYEIGKKEYQKYYNYLGMVIASKSKNGKVADEKYPPGYQYVGDPRYGTWRRDSSGNSFWEFYGKYAFFSQMFGMFGRPIYRSDWDTYRDYRSSGRPYFGRDRKYGTGGAYTKRTNPTFFERQRQKELVRKRRFTERVKRRARRSRMSGFRRRSGGFGK